MDPVILCDQITPRPGDHILDLGCGCGIMPLILGDRHPETRITGVDIQNTLADMAAENVLANQMQGRVQILNTDINHLTLQDIGSEADIIISNPPYKKKGTGRINPHRGKAIARHEILVTIDQIFAKAASLLAPDGSLHLIFPVDRMAEITAAAQTAGLFLKSTRPVKLSKKTPAFRILVSAVNHPAKKTEHLNPLILDKNHHAPIKAHQTCFNP
jgi:tRNA1Val (adenine37-N6)-methyltransferase